MKFKKFIIIGIVFLFFIFILVIGDMEVIEPNVEELKIVDNCVNVTIYYNRIVGHNDFILNETCLNKSDPKTCSNQSWYNVSFYNETRNYTVKKCLPYLLINKQNTDYTKQGYNCNRVGDDIICDSCIDGNCDGICDPNGGETCVKIDSKGKIMSKNSQVKWTKDMKIPLNKLILYNDNVPTITIQSKEVISP